MGQTSAAMPGCYCGSVACHACFVCANPYCPKPGHTSTNNGYPVRRAVQHGDAVIKGCCQGALDPAPSSIGQTLTAFFAVAACFTYFRRTGLLRGYGEAAHVAAPAEERAAAVEEVADTVRRSKRLRSRKERPEAQARA